MKRWISMLMCGLLAVGITAYGSNVSAETSARDLAPAHRKKRFSPG